MSNEIAEIPDEPGEPGPGKITAQQAKNTAVADLTVACYQRASTLDMTEAEQAKLMAEFPDNAFRKGAAGKENLIYIEHASLRERLSEVFGAGKWCIIPRNRWTEEFTTSRGAPGVRVYVEAMLVIRGCFVGEAVGDMSYYPNNESTNFGDAVEGAKTAALRRCAKELGIGLQAWKKDWTEGWWQRNPTGFVVHKQQQTAQQPQQQKPDPISKTTEDAIVCALAICKGNWKSEDTRRWVKTIIKRDIGQNEELKDISEPEAIVLLKALNAFNASMQEINQLTIERIEGWLKKMRKTWDSTDKSRFRGWASDVIKRPVAIDEPLRSLKQSEGLLLLTQLESLWNNMSVDKRNELQQEPAK